MTWRLISKAPYDAFSKNSEKKLYIYIFDIILEKISQEIVIKKLIK